MIPQYDDAVAGAGIIGLAHAYQLARGGRRVVVFERSAQAQGASIRNFGMLWPIGQPAGPMVRLALRSRAIWLDVVRAAGLWHEPVGSLNLAYHDDEATVLREFAEQFGGQGYDVSLLTPGEVLRRSPIVRPEGLVAGLWSSTEVCVDPRAVIAGLPKFLAEQYGVEFHFATTVTGFDASEVQAGGRRFVADRLWVCSGADLETLYPETLGSAGLVPCKLQMMRTPPFDWRLGPMLAAGLTLLHYKAFAACPGLTAVRDRMARQFPEHIRYGIHVMASQNRTGEMTLGDSHEYGTAISPFDNPAIDRLILNYLNSFLAVPDLTIAARWHGIYAKHPTEPFVVLNPAPDVTAIVGVGGAGMTLSFGVAERVVSDCFSDAVTQSDLATAS
jgi:D-hydroxyproline dehydrogenase subunit beta